MPIMYKSPNFKKFMPNGWSPGKRELNRDFLYTLMFNVDKKFFERVMEEAIDIRAKAHLA